MTTIVTMPLAKAVHLKRKNEKETTEMYTYAPHPHKKTRTMAQMLIKQLNRK